MPTGKDKLIVALDIEEKEDALKMIDVLSPVVDIFKVGIAPFTDYGETVLEKLASKGKKVFLDLKFHDIPNTVKNAARSAAKKGVFMMNFHCLGWRRMLKAAVEGAREGSAKAGVKLPLLLGVTVLTSMGPEDLREIGITEEVEKKVTMFAAMAKEAGLDGVVASAKEAHVVKKIAGKDFLVVTPGVRPEWAEDGDQKRVLSPREAIKGGADYIVVGRPVIEAKDPLLAANKIIEELKTL